MTTPALFDLAESTVPGETLTLADLDDLTAHVGSSLWDATFVPYQWVANGLSRILGRDIPVAVYQRDAYLGLLVEAQAALAGAS